MIKQQNKRIEKLSEKSPDAARAVQEITQREFGAIPFSVLRNVAKAKNAIIKTDNDIIITFFFILPLPIINYTKIFNYNIK